MEQLQTEHGFIFYTLTRKNIKNLNLRIKSTGDVMVSAPYRMPQKEIDQFLKEKSSWIMKHQATAQQHPSIATPKFTKSECFALFSVISDEIFPLFSSVLNGQRPILQVKTMKSRLGVCHIQKRIIVLNSRLAEMPLEAIEYVILHEYVHFIHPNHQAGFHQKMLELMPDYKSRRKLLR